MSGNIIFIFCVGNQLWDKVKVNVDCYTTENHFVQYNNSVYVSLVVTCFPVLMVNQFAIYLVSILLYEQPGGCPCEILGSSPVLSEVRVAHHSSVLCVFFCFCLLLLVLDLCVLCPMLPVSLNFPLLIAASGFSNVCVGGAYRNLPSHEIIRKSNVLRRLH